MMRKRRWVPAAAAVVAALTLFGTGCGHDTTGSAQSSTSNADNGGIPAAPGKMDPGKFRTTPMPAFGTDPGIKNAVEGQRMAEFVLVPSEIDPQLIHNGGGHVYDSGKGLSTLWLDGHTPDAAASNGMLAGFSSDRHSSEKNGDPADHELLNVVLQFPDPAAAAKAATDMSNSSRTADLGDGKQGQPIQLPDLPGTLAAGRDSNGSHSIEAFTPHREFVLYQYTNAPAAEANWDIATLTKTIRQQGALIDQFPAAPPDKLVDLPVDIDHVLRLTVPSLDPDKRVDAQEAVYGVRGAQHFALNPATTLADLEKTGVDRMAVNDTDLYRAKDGDSANTLRGLLSKEIQDLGGRKAQGPAGVPDVECFTKDSAQTKTGQEARCYVAKGRYVGEIMGDDLKTTQQETTAQYMILAAAEH